MSMSMNSEEPFSIEYDISDVLIVSDGLSQSQKHMMDADGMKMKLNHRPSGR